MPAGVKVVGLRELRLALGAVDAKLPAELTAELGDVAGGVRDLAQNKLRADVSTASTGAAASSIRTFSTQRGAGVRAGGARVPYYGWLDFGGTIRHQGSRHTHTVAHLIRREFRPEGRYVYPAADESARLVSPRVERLLERLFIKSGFTD